MANRRLDISQFPAVGVYTVEIDASVPPTEVDAQRTRVIVGFSRKGPKNTMVYLTSKRDAINVFGDVDPYLERRGSYFHRSLLNALDGGPVFALNLLPVDNDPNNGDKVQFISYSVDTESSNGFRNEQGTKVNELFKAFFDTQRFWRADEANFNAVKENFTLTRGKYFSIVNLGNTPLTILTRKSETAPRDFRLTVSEFFGKGNEPLITKPFDLVSDYFVDVIVLDGEWDDFQRLAADPIYGSYFDVEGLRTDRADAFLSSDGVNVVARYTGSILPDVLDNTESNQSINALINRDFLRTGLFCALNDTAIEDYDPEISTEHIDLVGHNLVSGTINKIDYLSYNQVINNELEILPEPSIFEETLTDVTNVSGDLGYTITDISVDDEVEVSDVYYTNLHINEVMIEADTDNNPSTTVYAELPHNLWLYGSHNPTNGQIEGIIGENLIFEENQNAWIETVLKLTQSGLNYELVINPSVLASHNPFNTTKDWYQDVTGHDYSNSIKWWDGEMGFKTLTYDIVQAPTGVGPEYTLIVSNLMLDGTPLTASEYDVVLEPLVIGDINIGVNRIQSTITSGTPNTLIIGKDNANYDKIYNLLNIDNATFIVNETGQSYEFNVVKYLDGTLHIDDANRQAIDGELEFPLVINYPDGNKIHEKFPIISRPANDRIIVSEAVGSVINTGDYLVGIFEGEQVLTSVRDKVRHVNETTGDITFEISTILPLVIENNEITKFDRIDNFVDHYNLHSLRGFEFKKSHMPDGTDTQMNKIYGVLDSSQSNLSEILSDRNIIDWRYIVDTFSGGIAPNMGGKSMLSRLAMTKKQGIALLNSPSIKEFTDSTNPFFTNLPTPSEPRPLLNSDFIRRGGNLDLGPSNRFTIPNEENGGKYCGVFGPYLSITEGGRRKVIPPAADISNNYMRKFRLGQPYAIVAGEPLGIISNPNLVGVEYDLLERDRANFEEIGINPIVFRDGVTKIFANLTGYQRVITPLNSLHVRDLLISIENTLINITSRYLFRKNTPTVRLEIQTIVETYLEGVATDGGIEWFNVTIDSTNNTPDIIDQRIALLDVEIQPSLGIEKFVNRITIYGAAGADGSGF